MEAIVFTKELANIKLTEMGAKATFECEISKEGLKVEWQKSGKKLRRDEHDITAKGKVHTLVIEKAKAEDAAEYSAVYENLTTKAKLSFAVPPSIGDHEYSDRLLLKGGAAAAIEIPFTGCPQPKATWKYKGGKLPDARRFNVDTIQNMTSMTIKKAQKSDAGKYTLTLENEFGQATFSIEIVIVDKPGAPERFKVKGVTETEVSLTWEEPINDGGSMVTGYILEKRETGKRAWQKVAEVEDMEFTVTGLTEGQTYNFQVAAVNEVGAGPFAELTKGVAPKSQYEPPGPPSAPEITEIRKESCILKWEAPEENGGTEVAGYFIERSAGGSARWLRISREPVPDVTDEVKDLIEGTEYAFRIVAQNKVGEGPPGPQSKPVVAKDPWGE